MGTRGRLEGEQHSWSIRGYRATRKRPSVEAAAAALSSFMQELNFDLIVEECEDPSAASSSSPAVQLHGYLTEKTIATSDNPYQYWGVDKS